MFTPAAVDAILRIAADLKGLSLYCSEAVSRGRPVLAYSVEKLGSRDRVRNAAKTDLSDRSRIDDRDLGKG